MCMSWLGTLGGTQAGGGGVQEEDGEGGHTNYRRAER